MATWNCYMHKAAGGLGNSQWEWSVCAAGRDSSSMPHGREMKMTPCLTARLSPEQQSSGQLSDGRS